MAIATVTMELEYKGRILLGRAQQEGKGKRRGYYRINTVRVHYMYVYIKIA
jgi:hypothetical protein